MALRSAHIAKKVASLSGREWLDLIEAQWALLVAQRTVRSRPIGSLATPIGARVEPDPARLTEARQVALALVRAARFGVFRPKCLVRSVALSRMLERRGINGAMVRVGVRRTGGEFLAHAWVELGGQTLADTDEHVGTFVPLTNLEVRRPD